MQSASAPRSAGPPNSASQGGAQGHETSISGVQKTNCSFQVIPQAGATPTIKLDLFHKTIACLSGIQIEFELAEGTSVQQARALAESANDRIVGIMVTQS